MKPFYKKAIAFWLVLLLAALLNATIRETTYKPWLTPFIGHWAHQISSVTGILLFYGAIYLFLSKAQDEYTQRDVVKIGLLWISMTLIFETFMNMYIRHLRFQEVLATYAFWRGDTWFFVLLSLLISPLLIFRKLHKRM